MSDYQLLKEGLHPRVSEQKKEKVEHHSSVGYSMMLTVCRPGLEQLLAFRRTLTFIPYFPSSTAPEIARQNKNPDLRLSNLSSELNYIAITEKLEGVWKEAVVN
jgi:hypothetical protein